MLNCLGLRLPPVWKKMAENDLLFDIFKLNHNKQKFVAYCKRLQQARDAVIKKWKILLKDSLCCV